jgi:hypothetical protein
VRWREGEGEREREGEGERGRERERERVIKLTQHLLQPVCTVSCAPEGGQGKG